MRSCHRCGFIVAPDGVVNAASPLLDLKGMTVRVKTDVKGANYHLVEADVGTVFCGPLKLLQAPERRKT